MSTQLGVRVSEDLLARIDAFAERDRRNRAAAMRLLLEEGLRVVESREAAAAGVYRQGVYVGTIADALTKAMEAHRDAPVEGA